MALSLIGGAAGKEINNVSNKAARQTAAGSIRVTPDSTWRMTCCNLPVKKAAASAMLSHSTSP
jgi:hypothetical protein